MMEGKESKLTYARRLCLYASTLLKLFLFNQLLIPIKDK